MKCVDMDTTNEVEVKISISVFTFFIHCKIQLKRRFYFTFRVSLSMQIIRMFELFTSRHLNCSILCVALKVKYFDSVFECLSLQASPFLWMRRWIYIFIFMPVTFICLLILLLGSAFQVLNIWTVQRMKKKITIFTIRGHEEESHEWLMTFLFVPLFLLLPFHELNVPSVMLMVTVAGRGMVHDDVWYISYFSRITGHDTHSIVSMFVLTLI